MTKKGLATAKELESVFAVAKGDYHALFMILLYTGQRLVDCVKLEWQNIDFEDGTLSVVPKKTARRSGKPVYIPLLPQLRQELESKLKAHAFILPELVSLYGRDIGSALSKEIKAVFKTAGCETLVKGQNGCEQF
ncbi:tyrosine-type recombinase/integrase [Pontiella sulfatireligans]|uniref:Tyr recombinase domain-containing protein n=1 Tax=Pontiella sulfatireligans TaxID=2750658 RepID=A0A6C2UPZ2_9BACT|nr:tyrosine-type recombinase/integrase [Pontiella sulfatireligans]VGO22345.1 hypothetical protein SCARR_04428 [Pontiella sulfatireligans]